MEKNNYTTKSDWENYWKNKVIVPYDKLFIDEYLYLLPKKGTFIEIGGFPGKFAGYFVKHFNYSVTILDYVIEPDIVRNVERSYALAEGTIHTIQDDFFEHTLNEKYDVVSSFGFIEHFENTALVLKKHVDLLEQGGTLIVTLPNFRGINGLVQKFFDFKNYSIHNIGSMKIKNLKGIIKELELHEFSVEFHGKPTIWLEEDAKVNSFTKHIILFISKIIYRIPFSKNRFLAPYIVITGIKS